MAQNGVFWPVKQHSGHQKNYSRGTSDPFRVVGPPMEAHCGPKQRAKGSQAIGMGTQRGGGGTGSKRTTNQARKTRFLTFPEHNHLGPSKARFVRNYGKNTVQKDLTGGGPLYTEWDRVLCTDKLTATNMRSGDAKL